MRKLIAIASAITLALGLPAGIAAQATQAKPEPPKAESKTPASIAGKWTLIVDPGSGPLELPMELKLDGTKLTGTVQGPQGEPASLAGEYTDGKVAFVVTAPDGNAYSFKGASKQDGSMGGTVAGPDGSEIAWSATRVKG